MVRRGSRHRVIVNDTGPSFDVAERAIGTLHACPGKN
jgi:hypothetical protein